jgi:replication factor A2
MIGTTTMSSKYNTPYGGGDMSVNNDSNSYSKRYYEQSGGFFTDNSTVGSTAGISASPSSKKANVVQPTLRPMTLKQLLQAEQPYPDANFSVDHADVHQAIVIGCVRRVQELPAGILYTIEDGTGSMDIRLWNTGAPSGVPGIEDGEETERQITHEGSSLREGVWVRVSGQLRAFNGKKTIHAYDIQPIEDFNEVIYHMVRCVQFHYYYAKGVMVGKDQSYTHEIKNAATNVPTSTTNAQQQYLVSGLLPEQKLVLDLFSSCTSNEGLHIQDVCRELKSRLKEEETKKIVNWLLDEGHLYSTIDDFHFKGTYAA